MGGLLSGPPSSSAKSLVTDNIACGSSKTRSDPRKDKTNNIDVAGRPVARWPPTHRPGHSQGPHAARSTALANALCRRRSGSAQAKMFRAPAAFPLLGPASSPFVCSAFAPAARGANQIPGRVLAPSGCMQENGRAVRASYMPHPNSVLRCCYFQGGTRHAASHCRCPACKSVAHPHSRPIYPPSRAIGIRCCSARPLMAGAAAR